jgi:nitrate/TMAO reductase-like tetraheme cytochrome c subunit
MDPKSEKSYKKFKRLTIISFFTLVMVFLLWVGVHQTSNSAFCSLCHNMKPELNTWQASSHSKIECVACHIPPGPVNFVKKKVKGLLQVYDYATDNYVAPIRMIDPIPNAACEQCHNMSNRNVSTSGDITIPHDKHLAKGILCVKCHQGVAHGDIADRKVTFKADYAKWDPSIGKLMMNDRKAYLPNMDTCMECHKLRKVTTECRACHTTGMLPDSHKDPAFKAGAHGKLAEAHIADCNNCHQYMSEVPIDGFTVVPEYQQMLDKGKPKPPVTAAMYAKQNTFCKKCHGIKPASHKTDDWMSTHGQQAGQDRQLCMTCHDNNVRTSDPVTKVSCATCHPSSHSQNPSWKTKHPIALPAKPQVTKFCLTCHNPNVCTTCHKNLLTDLPLARKE